MKAIVVTDQTAGTAGMKLVEPRTDPDATRLASLEGANYGDVVVEVHAVGIHRESAGVALDLDRSPRP